MSRSADLYALQQTDSELDARSQRLAEIHAALGETDELLAARARLKTAGDALAGLRTQQRDQELALQSINQKWRLSEQKLYGGKVRNPKELADLQEEVASLDRRKAVLENELLEIMLLAEEAEAEQQAAEAESQRTESLWQSTQANLQNELADQESQMAILAANRKKQTTWIDPADLSAYENLRERRGGLAVVLLLESECQGCMTTVSAARVREARHNTLAYCGSCGRILYLGDQAG